MNQAAGSGPQLVITGDGSPTLYSPRFDATYHSRYSAIDETEHVYVEAGFRAWLRAHPSCQRPVDVFDLGLGTGLNCLLTVRAAGALGVAVSYTAVEAYPVPSAVVTQLDYAEQMPDFPAAEVLASVHAAAAAEMLSLQPGFAFRWEASLFQDYDAPAASVDVFYYDAFAPRNQPELWDREILARARRLIRPGGILVTYCARGQVRRDLASLGFVVKSLPGAGTKREMTQAILPDDDCLPT